MISIIIATDRRPHEIKECLESLKGQSLLPDEIIIAHGGSDAETEETVNSLVINNDLKVRLKYYNIGPLGAAVQRNKGAEKATGDILLFLDDDVLAEPDFIKEITSVFEKDPERKIAGVSGTIVNQTYTRLRRINKFLFDISLRKGERRASYAGKVVGPAVNFLPEDKRLAEAEQAVDWLPSCCSAYRKDIFLEYEFNKNFKGYSFMEDVELSSRIGKKYRLINTSKARCFHKDLGGRTHKSWIFVEKMKVLNRWYVMTKVLEKYSLGDKIRFFYYQIVYCTLAEINFVKKRPDIKNKLARLTGRLWGIFSILALSQKAKNL
ncbi:MAG: glycosyltransferase family 2 protein [Candidatus Omnitrophica bacterium]|nr:glycosyltransferase family 2 protein [Candidatus Omnitrophota bacterium]